MTIETIQIQSQDQWLAERVKDVTSTEVSALFDLNPYLTQFELYQQKSTGQVVKIPENTRMKWGKRLEAPIALGVAEDEGWDISKLDVYMRQTETRIGSSFDYMITSSSDGPGIMEIKNVDGLQYRQKWTEDEAPEHIELQIQHQMLVSGMKWTALVAMVGGNDPKIIYRNFDEDIAKSIAERVAAFWSMVLSGTAPSADYSRDADAIISAYRQVHAGQIFDATGDNEIASMVMDYQTMGAALDDLETRRKAIKAQLLEKIGTAEKVIAPWGSISAGMTKDTPPKIITADMVGQEIGGRKGYRNFKLNLKKENA